MIIVGLQKLSLVDYPGTISAVVFTQGCDLRCGYCHNPELIPAGVTNESRLSEEEVLSFLDARRKMIDGLVITGGEPTINKDLPEFIKKAKTTGLKVKLDTNGTNPGLIKKILESGEADYIAMDIKTSPEKYDMVTKDKEAFLRIKETIALLMKGKIPYEFRTTCAPGIIDKEDIEKIGNIVRGASRYFLQQFRPGITLDAAYQNIKPYLPQQIEEFKNIMSEYVKRVETRGV